VAIALLAAITSGLLYPGGTVLDASTRGYSFTHNFLSDLGSTVAFNDGRNTVGALLFDVAIIVAVVVLADTCIAVVHARSFKGSSVLKNESAAVEQRLQPSALRAIMKRRG
jgi:hypothetical membrane protein